MFETVLCILPENVTGIHPGSQGKIPPSTKQTPPINTITEPYWEVLVFSMPIINARANRIIDTPSRGVPRVFITIAFWAPASPSSLINCETWLYPGLTHARMNTTIVKMMGPTIAPNVKNRIFLPDLVNI
jgi:hypothetical protein